MAELLCLPYTGDHPEEDRGRKQQHLRCVLFLKMENSKCVVEQAVYFWPPVPAKSPIIE